MAIEVRSVNNRYLKLMLRAPEPYNLLEAEVERVVRRHVRRGTLQVLMRLDRPHQPQDYRINQTAVQSYVEQVWAACDTLGIPRPDVGQLVGSLLTLPGVVPEAGSGRRRSKTIGRSLTGCFARPWNGCRPCARKKASAWPRSF